MAHSPGYSIRPHDDDTFLTPGDRESLYNSFVAVFAEKNYFFGRYSCIQRLM
jgi:hypothetical protein